MIAPSRPTTWSGIVTLREPGETPVVGDEPNSPPPAASQIETEIVSPIPIFGAGGWACVPNRVWKLTAGCLDKTAMTLLSMSTMSYRVWLSCVASSMTLAVVGPAQQWQRQ